MLDMIRSYLDGIGGLVMRIPPEGIRRVTNTILEAWRNGRRVMVFGNGGDRPRRRISYATWPRAHQRPEEGA